MKRDGGAKRARGLSWERERKSPSARRERETENLHKAGAGW
jgi:hypothetical protein